MLSPKMQRSVRVQDNQIIHLADRAQYDHSMHGHLQKRTSDCNRWQTRWFLLYQNLLFYYDNENSSKPSGIIFLEGSYCERLTTPPACVGSPVAKSSQKEDKLQHCFTISYRRENQRHYELKAASESECNAWIGAIREASFNKLLLQKEELEQKHVHLLQVVESEKTAKWQYTQQCEELSTEIKKLRNEIFSLRKEYSKRPSICISPVIRRESFGSNIVTGNVANGSDIVSGVGSACTSARGSIGETSRAYCPHNECCHAHEDQEPAELKKIKKVQSFFRGWLCRRRWKQIVDDYINSPHAESMRKRNSLVFSMVEAEEEYCEQLEVLVSCFLRPFKMAASSKRPPLTHEDVNSIFLNSETVLFLHQIFLKGLTSRLESWPTLVLGDLFDMLLPMLSIYQEYVRNHHYSLQVLTECKSRAEFSIVLRRLEAKPACKGRSLEMFLTYPMHQVPRYIITLHELLAHTPYDHVERKSLLNARQQLEDLSRQMHDEVSETENLRKNLAVERMIVEGCDILLDVNQVFVRQGSLIHVPEESRGRFRRRLSSFKSEREAVRQCFLFSNYLIIANRTSGGRLHLLPDFGRIPLADAHLIEEPNDSDREDDADPDVLSQRTYRSSLSVNEAISTGNRDFKVVVESKSNVKHCIHLVAPTVQDKEAWISDISQCIDNIHLHTMLSPTTESIASSIGPQLSLHSDPRLFTDDIDIRFSRTLNSCKLPQVRYATPERLLQRLTDLRFLSIDFLNTFLLTYRVFTDGETVLNALKKVFYDAQPNENDTHDNVNERLNIPGKSETDHSAPRRPSGASSVSGYCSEGADRDRSMSGESTALKLKTAHRTLNEQYSIDDGATWITESIDETQAESQDKNGDVKIQKTTTVEISVHQETPTTPPAHGFSPTTIITTSSSMDTLNGESTPLNLLSGPSSPSNLSSITLVGSTGSGSVPNENDKDSSQEKREFTYTKDYAPTSPLPERKRKPAAQEDVNKIESEPKAETSTTQKITTTTTTTTTTESDTASKSAKKTEIISSKPKIISAVAKSVLLKDEGSKPSSTHSTPSKTSSNVLQPMSYLTMNRRPSAGTIGVPVAALTQHRRSLQLSSSEGGFGFGPKFPPIERPISPRSSRRASKTTEKIRKTLFGTPSKDNSRRFSESDDDTSNTTSFFTTPRGSVGGSSYGTISPRASIQHDAIPCSSKVGVVITSYRQSHRSFGPDPLWSSTSTAAAAFAIATSASSNPRDDTFEQPIKENDERLVSSPATIRVLNVLRHWVSKHFQDFEQDAALRAQTIKFLEAVTISAHLLPVEIRAASQLLRLLCREDMEHNQLKLQLLLAPPTIPSKESIETLSALEIAEQMTYLDHQIFVNIRSEEFLGQAWMKSSKKTQAEHISQMTTRFNDGSRLVCSEIISRNNMQARVAAIEKWTAVADICRCLHNFNGVLQVCAAFTNAAVFRLKKTWDKVPKTIKHTITKLQAVVCSDGRFRAMREALHRCDPPCIPYLGMYLTDLSFIEEGTPDFTPDGLLNFSKMRMLAHVIREIRHFQQTPYKIEHIPKVTSYLLDGSLLLDDDELYSKSLQIEPRTSRLSAPNTLLV
ncbi:ras-specific guanine nucleotide-releasing factor 2-like isoform X3 [Sitodiplosis mosellana]|uniref:ras-specific guanine nucleotide-releasing factor 2-like isoform X3 n=1 Tax=Sitodiplosis mosellana TaxID=263140 RepID=UPI0024446E17|nr:ras-specific guanine nucleotide-releasing factor 2-like isoform X3 [Sitodiplosis mosellana]